MTSRQMQIAFEEYIRNTNPDLEFDTNINTDVIFQFLTRAQEEYVTENFLIGDTIQDQINAIRKRSDVVKNLIKRGAAVQTYTLQNDGGYLGTFGTDVTTPVALTDYWMFLSGVLISSDLPDTTVGNNADKKIELDLINHYDLQKKVRTVNNEPVYKYTPITLEDENKFTFYLDKEQDAAIATKNNIKFHIIYLAKTTAIDLNTEPILSVQTHNAIVEKAAETYMSQYKTRLGINTTKPNG